MAKDLNKSNFEQETSNSSAPVVVDFWASWCGPCRAQSPILDKLEQEMGSNVKVCKVNVDDEQELASEFEVMTIPTLIVFKNGKMIKRVVGVQTLDSLKVMIS